jgi:glycosyltransferase involved in cell wall biosynthesis
MVGDGPERPVCEDVVKNLDLQDAVRFLGKQEQIENILAVSDLFLLPSEYESFGLAALEAMAAHVPVLSANTGGLPEINIDGKTGYMFNVGDTKTAGELGIKILENKETLNQFKEAAYQQALTFDIHNIVPLYENLYSRFCRMDCE